MRQRKICMLGAYGVGKTSLVRRYVESLFDERYQTTIGVKIDKKVVELEDGPMTLMVWDLAGEDELEQIRLSHVRGASGLIVVADGCRMATLETAAEVEQRVRGSIGEVPWVLALNKGDLAEEWEIDRAAAGAKFGSAPAAMLVTSAKTGDGVEAVFREIARTMRAESPGPL